MGPDGVFIVFGLFVIVGCVLFYCKYTQQSRHAAALQPSPTAHAANSSMATAVVMGTGPGSYLNGLPQGTVMRMPNRGTARGTNRPPERPRGLRGIDRSQQSAHRRSAAIPPELNPYQHSSAGQVVAVARAEPVHIPMAIAEYASDEDVESGAGEGRSQRAKPQAIAVAAVYGPAQRACIASSTRGAGFDRSLWHSVAAAIARCSAQRAAPGERNRALPLRRQWRRRRRTPATLRPPHDRILFTVAGRAGTVFAAYGS
ncbi:hypothetical protein JKP88DRAFT_263338 [Tribonema minus]|uniref:Uncharacterized protein n=1 Tax=Tribonema minus TaxID=303371 RepID=A0A836CEK0_9STRA|nr:hypothetical protein JKP88DRAFT_263338 [Tribonema minus]